MDIFGCTLKFCFFAFCFWIFIFFSLWDNCSVTCSFKKLYRTIPYIIFLVSPNGNILQNYSVISHCRYCHGCSPTRYRTIPPPQGFITCPLESPKHFPSAPSCPHFDLLQKKFSISIILSSQECYIIIPSTENEVWGALPYSCQVNIDVCVRHFAPTDTDMYVWGGSSLLLGVDGISGSRRPPYCSPHDLPRHYKEGTSLLLGGDESSDSPRANSDTTPERVRKDPLLLPAGCGSETQPSPLSSPLAWKTHLFTWPSLIPPWQRCGGASLELCKSRNLDFPLGLCLVCLHWATVFLWCLAGVEELTGSCLEVSYCHFFIF